MIGAAAAPRLDKSEAEFLTPSVGAAEKAAAAKAARRRRYDLQSTAAKLLPSEGVAKCGRYVAGGKGGSEYAAIKVGARGAHLSRVLRCNSVWHCPCCAGSIAAGRRDEVRALTDAHQAAGGRVYMLTLTIGHHLFDRCEHTRKGVALAWRHVIAGKAWVQLKVAFGIIGNVRALEVTHGGNGWHPHLHILLFTAGPINADHLGAALIARWAMAVDRCGWGRVSPAAQKFVECGTPGDAGDYVTKFSPEWEMTHAHLKAAKGGGRSPWQLLAECDVSDDPRAHDLWREYAIAFKGARQLTYSKGLRERYGLREETDAALADREPPARTIIEIHEDLLRALVKRKMVARALEIAETGGVVALVKFFSLFPSGGGAARVRIVEHPEERPPPDDPTPSVEQLANILKLPVAVTQRV